MDRDDEEKTQQVIEEQITRALASKKVSFPSLPHQAGSESNPKVTSPSRVLDLKLLAS